MKIKYEITLFVTHVLTTHVTRVNVTCQWVSGDMSVGHVTSLVRTSHVTHVNESHRTCERFMSHLKICCDTPAREVGGWGRVPFSRI